MIIVQNNAPVKAAYELVTLQNKTYCFGNYLLFLQFAIL